MLQARDILPEGFAPITLDAMDSVRLMNRVDTKYVVAASCLPEIISRALPYYFALEVDGVMLNPYDSLYFDTPSLDMYHTHHCGKVPRQKVRTRTYLESMDTFLEIKRKNNHGRTKKKRTGIPREEFSSFCSDVQACDFLSMYCSFPSDSLEPALGTRFDRITLVNREMSERLTVDTNLQFSNVRTSRKMDLDGLAILELKQSGHSRSHMADILSDMRIKPLGFSKYCMGTAFTDNGIKKNNFKERIRTVEKIASL